MGLVPEHLLCGVLISYVEFLAAIVYCVSCYGHTGYMAYWVQIQPKWWKVSDIYLGTCSTAALRPNWCDFKCLANTHIHTVLAGGLSMSHARPSADG